MNKNEDNISAFSCKLTTPELQKRKATILSALKQKITDRKELTDGFAFCFPGDDEILGQLVDFIKTEKLCCPFFTFTLSVNGDKNEIWLELTGAEGVKDFMATELGLSFDANG